MSSTAHDSPKRHRGHPHNETSATLNLKTRSESAGPSPAPSSAVREEEKEERDQKDTGDAASTERCPPLRRDPTTDASALGDQTGWRGPATAPQMTAASRGTAATVERRSPLHSDRYDTRQNRSGLLSFTVFDEHGDRRQVQSSSSVWSVNDPNYTGSSAHENNATTAPVSRSPLSMSALSSSVGRADTEADQRSLTSQLPGQRPSHQQITSSTEAPTRIAVNSGAVSSSTAYPSEDSGSMEDQASPPQRRVHRSSHGARANPENHVDVPETPGKEETAQDATMGCSPKQRYLASSPLGLLRHMFHTDRTTSVSHADSIMASRSPPPLPHSSSSSSRTLATVTANGPSQQSSLSSNSWREVPTPLLGSHRDEMRGRSSGTAVQSASLMQERPLPTAIQSSSTTHDQQHHHHSSSLSSSSVNEKRASYTYAGSSATPQPQRAARLPSGAQSPTLTTTQLHASQLPLYAPEQSTISASAGSASSPPLATLHTSIAGQMQTYGNVNAAGSSFALPSGTVDGDGAYFPVTGGPSQQTQQQHQQQPPLLSGRDAAPVRSPRNTELFARVPSWHSILPPSHQPIQPTTTTTTPSTTTTRTATPTSHVAQVNAGTSPAQGLPQSLSLSVNDASGRWSTSPHPALGLPLQPTSSPKAQPSRPTPLQNVQALAFQLPLALSPHAQSMSSQEARSFSSPSPPPATQLQPRGSPQMFVSRSGSGQRMPLLSEITSHASTQHNVPTLSDATVSGDTDSQLLPHEEDVAHLSSGSAEPLQSSSTKANTTVVSVTADDTMRVSQQPHGLPFAPASAPPPRSPLSGSTGGGGTVNPAPATNVSAASPWASLSNPFRHYPKASQPPPPPPLSASAPPPPALSSSSATMMARSQQQQQRKEQLPSYSAREADPDSLMSTSRASVAANGSPIAEAVACASQPVWSCASSPLPAASFTKEASPAATPLPLQGSTHGLNEGVTTFSPASPLQDAEAAAAAAAAQKDERSESSDPAVCTREAYSPFPSWLGFSHSPTEPKLKRPSEATTARGPGFVPATLPENESAMTMTSASASDAAEGSRRDDGNENESSTITHVTTLVSSFPTARSHPHSSHVSNSSLAPLPSVASAVPNDGEAELNTTVTNGVPSATAVAAVTSGTLYEALTPLRVSPAPSAVVWALSTSANVSSRSPDSDAGTADPYGGNVSVAPLPHLPQRPQSETSTMAHGRDAQLQLPTATAVPGSAGLASRTASPPMPWLSPSSDAINGSPATTTLTSLLTTSLNAVASPLFARDEASSGPVHNSSNVVNLNRHLQHHQSVAATRCTSVGDGSAHPSAQTGDNPLALQTSPDSVMGPPPAPALPPQEVRTASLPGAALTPPPSHGFSSSSQERGEEALYAATPPPLPSYAWHSTATTATTERRPTSLSLSLLQHVSGRPLRPRAPPAHPLPPPPPSAPPSTSSPTHMPLAMTTVHPIAGSPRPTSLLPSSAATERSPLATSQSMCTTNTATASAPPGLSPSSSSQLTRTMAASWRAGDSVLNGTESRQPNSPFPSTVRSGRHASPGATAVPASGDTTRRETSSEVFVNAVMSSDPSAVYDASRALASSFSHVLQPCAASVSIRDGSTIGAAHQTAEETTVAGGNGQPMQTGEKVRDPSRAQSCRGQVLTVQSGSPWRKSSALTAAAVPTPAEGGSAPSQMVRCTNVLAHEAENEVPLHHPHDQPMPSKPSSESEAMPSSTECVPAVWRASSTNGTAATIVASATVTTTTVFPADGHMTEVNTRSSISTGSVDCEDEPAHTAARTTTTASNSILAGASVTERTAASSSSAISSASPIVPPIESAQTVATRIRVFADAPSLGNHVTAPSSTASATSSAPNVVSSATSNPTRVVERVVEDTVKRTQLFATSDVASDPATVAMATAQESRGQSVEVESSCGALPTTEREAVRVGSSTATPHSAATHPLRSTPSSPSLSSPSPPVSALTAASSAVAIEADGGLAVAAVAAKGTNAHLSVPHQRIDITDDDDSARQQSQTASPSSEATLVEEALSPSAGGAFGRQPAFPRFAARAPSTVLSSKTSIVANATSASAAPRSVGNESAPSARTGQQGSALGSGGYSRELTLSLSAEATLATPSAVAGRAKLARGEKRKDLSVAQASHGVLATAAAAAASAPHSMADASASTLTYLSTSTASHTQAFATTSSFPAPKTPSPSGTVVVPTLRASSGPPLSSPMLATLVDGNRPGVVASGSPESAAGAAAAGRNVSPSALTTGTPRRSSSTSVPTSNALPPIPVEADASLSTFPPSATAAAAVDSSAPAFSRSTPTTAEASSPTGHHGFPSQGGRGTKRRLPPSSPRRRHPSPPEAPRVGIVGATYGAFDYDPFLARELHPRPMLTLHLPTFRWPWKRGGTGSGAPATIAGNAVTVNSASTGAGAMSSHTTAVIGGLPPPSPSSKSTGTNSGRRGTIAGAATRKGEGSAAGTPKGVPKAAAATMATITSATASAASSLAVPAAGGSGGGGAGEGGRLGAQQPPPRGESGGSGRLHRRLPQTAVTPTTITFNSSATTAGTDTSPPMAVVGTTTTITSNTNGSGGAQVLSGVGGVHRHRSASGDDLFSPFQPSLSQRVGGPSVTTSSARSRAAHSCFSPRASARPQLLHGSPVDVTAIASMTTEVDSAVNPSAALGSGGVWTTDPTASTMMTGAATEHSRDGRTDSVSRSSTPRSPDGGGEGGTVLPEDSGSYGTFPLDPSHTADFTSMLSLTDQNSRSSLAVTQQELLSHRTGTAVGGGGGVGCGAAPHHTATLLSCAHSGSAAGDDSFFGDVEPRRVLAEHYTSARTPTETFLLEMETATTTTTRAAGRVQTPSMHLPSSVSPASTGSAVTAAAAAAAMTTTSTGIGSTPSVTMNPMGQGGFATATTTDAVATSSRSPHQMLSRSAKTLRQRRATTLSAVNGIAGGVPSAVNAPFVGGSSVTSYPAIARLSTAHLSHAVTTAAASTAAASEVDEDDFSRTANGSFATSNGTGLPVSNGRVNSSGGVGMSSSSSSSKTRRHTTFAFHSHDLLCLLSLVITLTCLLCQGLLIRDCALFRTRRFCTPHRVFDTVHGNLDAMRSTSLSHDVDAGAGVYQDLVLARMRAYRDPAAMGTAYSELRVAQMRRRGETLAHAGPGITPYEFDSELDLNAEPPDDHFFYFDAEPDATEAGTADHTRGRGTAADENGVHAGESVEASADGRDDRDRARDGHRRRRRTRVAVVTDVNSSFAFGCVAQASAILSGMHVHYLDFGRPYGHITRYDRYVEFARVERLRDSDVIVALDSDIVFTGIDIRPELEYFVQHSAASPDELDVAAVRTGVTPAPMIYGGERVCMRFQIREDPDCASDYDAYERRVAAEARAYGYEYRSNEHGVRNPYRYLNGGVVIARVWALRKMHFALQAFTRLRRPSFQRKEWFCDQSIISTLFLELLHWELGQSLMQLVHLQQQVEVTSATLSTAVAAAEERRRMHQDLEGGGGLPPEVDPVTRRRIQRLRRQLAQDIRAIAFLRRGFHDSTLQPFGLPGGMVGVETQNRVIFASPESALGADYVAADYVRSPCKRCTARRERRDRGESVEASTVTTIGVAAEVPSAAATEGKTACDAVERAAADRFQNDKQREGAFGPQQPHPSPINKALEAQTTSLRGLTSLPYWALDTVRRATDAVLVAPLFRCACFVTTHIQSRFGSGAKVSAAVCATHRTREDGKVTPKSPSTRDGELRSINAAAHTTSVSGGPQMRLMDGYWLSAPLTSNTTVQVYVPHSNDFNQPPLCIRKADLNEKKAEGVTESQRQRVSAPCDRELSETLRRTERVVGLRGVRESRSGAYIAPGVFEAVLNPPVYILSMPRYTIPSTPSDGVAEAAEEAQRGLRGGEVNGIAVGEELGVHALEANWPPESSQQPLTFRAGARQAQPLAVQESEDANTRRRFDHTEDENNANDGNEGEEAPTTSFREPSSSPTTARAESPAEEATVTKTPSRRVATTRSESSALHQFSIEHSLIPRAALLAAASRMERGTAREENTLLAPHVRDGPNTIVDVDSDPNTARAGAAVNERHFMEENQQQHRNDDAVYADGSLRDPLASPPPTSHSSRHGGEQSTANDAAVFADTDAAMRTDHPRAAPLEACTEGEEEENKADAQADSEAQYAADDLARYRAQVGRVYPAGVHFSGGWKEYAFNRDRHFFSWFVPMRHSAVAYDRAIRILQHATLHLWYPDEERFMSYTDMCGLPLTRG